MKLNPIFTAIAGLVLLISPAPAATLYVDQSNTNPTPPYADWTTAATNVQDAIDASAGGDQILVTNGIYQFGGKVMFGDLTNRVALDRPVTVQSVNGPWATIIQGAGATNGAAAVRCAWLTNGAALIGFTLRNGATRSTGDPSMGGPLESGGGVWCDSSNALVSNCVILSNAAASLGGGIYHGRIWNSFVSGNVSGGGAAAATMINCTVVSNSGSGVLSGTLTNCIVYYNSPSDHPGAVTFAYSCTTTPNSGPGNISAAPQFFVDGIHLATNSPCIGAGTNVVTGTDIFGQPWANPPSIGCAENTRLPVLAIPRIQLTSNPPGFTIGIAGVIGQLPFSFSWRKDGALLEDDGHFSGTQTTNLAATGVSLGDAGDYQLVASNTFGVVTSAVAQLVIHCVEVAGTNPVAPYSSWTTAAANIQDAITAAAAGEIVLVTNGLYATGGKSMDGVITNRVSVDKAILVQSVGGPAVTIIQGALDPVSTNGPGAVRCVWMTTNAILSGFTLYGGATIVSNGAQPPATQGGGIFAATFNAFLYNCVIATNYTSFAGGGALGATLNNCTLIGNHSFSPLSSTGGGGGASSSVLNNCRILFNTADQSSGGGAGSCNATNCFFMGNRSPSFGGAAYQGRLVHCTVVDNISGSFGGAVANATASNCIVYWNTTIFGMSGNYSSSTLTYSDSAPLPPGIGNIIMDPQLLADNLHLAATSPCIGAGTPGVLSGTDIDGQPWNNPPSIGCDEWQPGPVIIAPPAARINFLPRDLTLAATMAGQSPFIFYWTKDGVSISDDSHYANSATANLLINTFGPDDTGFYQFVASNAFGVATSQVARVVIHLVDAGGTNPLAPFSTWATAATNIQDAIDASSAGDIVLVTNGIYSTGGKVVAGDLTNRVALDKAIIVTSVNGYAATVIQGAFDPTTTDGPGAVRCAYVADGASLQGFTLLNGATRSTGDPSMGGPLESGGGAFCVSTNGAVSNCVLTNNNAIYGAGICSGTLNNSLVIFNLATYGAGAFNSTLNNCTVINNFTTTPFSNRGAGTYGGVVRNSIVLDNNDNFLQGGGEDNYNLFQNPTMYSYSCSLPPPAGTGNIGAADPKFLDLYHLSVTSPCRSVGSAAYVTGTDADGESWANPPSMGWDEVVVSNLNGPLAVSFRVDQTTLLPNRYDFFNGTINGRAASVTWDFGDGPAVNNHDIYANHPWTNAGDYTVTFTAYNNDNPAGVSTNAVIHVLSLIAPQLQLGLLMTNGFQFQFGGQSNANYTIEYATNLASPVTWQTLQNIYFSNGGVLQISDPTATNEMRFYRVIAQ